MKIKFLAVLFILGLLFAEVRDFLLWVMTHTETWLRFLGVSPQVFPYAPYVVLSLAAIAAIHIFRDAV